MEPHSKAAQHHALHIVSEQASDRATSPPTLGSLQSIRALQSELHQRKLFLEFYQHQVREWHKLQGFNSPLKFLMEASHINILSFDLGNCGTGERGIKLAGLVFFSFKKTAAQENDPYLQSPAVTGWQLWRCSGQEQKRLWWVRIESVWHSHTGSWEPE